MAHCKLHTAKLTLYTGYSKMHITYCKYKLHTADCTVLLTDSSSQTSGFKNRSLDLTLSDYPAGNPEYVQTTIAGHILFGF